jgi:hypothetical protein
MYKFTNNGGGIPTDVQGSTFLALISLGVQHYTLVLHRSKDQRLRRYQHHAKDQHNIMITLNRIYVMYLKRDYEIYFLDFSSIDFSEYYNKKQYIHRSF